MQVKDVSRAGGNEVLKLSAAHTGDATDSGNSFSTNGQPTAFLEIIVDNPEEVGNAAIGDVVYVTVDFADKTPPPADEEMGALEQKFYQTEGGILEQGTRYYTYTNGVRSPNFTGDVSEHEHTTYVVPGWKLTTIKADEPIGHNSATSPVGGFNS